MPSHDTPLTYAEPLPPSPCGASGHDDLRRALGYSYAQDPGEANS